MHVLFSSASRICSLCVRLFRERLRATNRHLLIVAAEFRIGGFLLAVVAIAALAFAVDLGWLLRQAPPLEDSGPLDIGTYRVGALIVNVARARTLMRLLA